jgi:hypothetical protein
MPKTSALTTLSHLMFCGTLILLIATPQAAGQSLEPEKDRTENVRPQFHFITGGPSGLRVEQLGSGMGTDPSFLKGPALPATPQQQIHFPGQQQTPATVPPLILPSLLNFPKFAQTVPSPGLKSSGPFNVQIGQTAFTIIPQIPIPLPPQFPEQQNLCSVPLLRVQPDPSKNFTIRQAPAPPTDPAMVVKPLAPSCDEKTSVQKPGLSMPPPSNRR